ncbi:hypothetical protein [Pseudanabaena sp. BC1403]|nr:hypothetical protein [Pseudanabaena sp. BC1403]
MNTKITHPVRSTNLNDKQSDRYSKQLELKACAVAIALASSLQP